MIRIGDWLCRRSGIKNSAKESLPSVAAKVYAFGGDGYWAEATNGDRYHISGLVVELGGLRKH